MKRLIALLLLVILCVSMLCTGASAERMSDFVGYWEIQNVAVDGYTMGASHVGIDQMAAVVHDDGIMLLLNNNEMAAYYINGSPNNYYIYDSGMIVELSIDNQGRLHYTMNDEGTVFDFRLRRARLDRINSRLSSYVGDWEVIAADAKKYGNVTMKLYNDGYGVIIFDDFLVGVRLCMNNGKACLMDDEGLIMNIKNNNNGTISFSINFTAANYIMPLTMQPVK